MLLWKQTQIGSSIKMFHVVSAYQSAGILTVPEGTRSMPYERHSYFWPIPIKLHHYRRNRHITLANRRIDDLLEDFAAVCGQRQTFSTKNDRRHWILLNL